MKRLLIILIAAACCLNTLSQTVDLRRGLLAEYLFEGNASDTSGNGRHGQVVGATLTQDRFGYETSAYAFDGTRSYIAVPGTSSLHLTNGGFSLSAWVAVDASTPVPIGLVICGKHYYGYDNGYFLGLGNERLSFFTGTRGWLFAPGNHVDNRWHHVVGTFDGTNQLIYLDGLLVDSQTNIPPIQNSADIVIGATASVSSFFKGTIDDIRIYSRPLGGEEVGALFSEGELRLGIEVSQVRVCWDTQTNHAYRLQYRSELTTNDWVDFGTSTLGTGSRACVTDDVVGPRRFYRVIHLP